MTRFFIIAVLLVGACGSDRKRQEGPKDEVLNEQKEVPQEVNDKPSQDGTLGYRATEDGEHRFSYGLMDDGRVRFFVIKKDDDEVIAFKDLELFRHANGAITDKDGIELKKYPNGSCFEVNVKLAPDRAYVGNYLDAPIVELFYFAGNEPKK